ncbi:MAG: peptidoglycan bridge formation glycyltransferase FemA/FemB family protein [Candidatus Levybacteria bacterium]|nr:peptidoglycan bridge formation glycyltransferase FemA/FemB family protein [Candidatus Levybacteria bacterium]
MNNHPLQTFEWGEFRKKTGVKVIRGKGFQLTIHQIPHLPWTIGYFPKGPIPSKEMVEELKKIGKENNCLFIQLEPNVQKISDFGFRISDLGLRPAVRPLFTRYTFQLDLTKSEEELLKNMHPKTRYNIKIAQKHGVEIVEDNSDEAFEQYLRLMTDTTKRQRFYAHDENYHRLMWETLKPQKPELRGQRLDKNKLTAHLLLAKYHPLGSNNQGLTLVAWILFVYKDTLYYPYGASSNEYKEVMASNLMMWEAIKFGKRLGLKKLDMWGALGPNPDKNDPWYGFHRFKEGYGGKLVEFIGSYDLVINPLLYQAFKLADLLRWFLLRIKK